MVNKKPTANITVDKSRLKIHDNRTVYLKNGDSFEFELFNPTQQTVLAKISIDGKLISNSGLVLKPGQRYFLERYLDQAKKFLFSTYDVEGESEEVKEAISKNGNIKIDFYNEYHEPVKMPIYVNPITWITPTISPYTYTTGTSGTNFKGSGNLTTSNAYYSNSNVSMDSLSMESSTYTTTCLSNKKDFFSKSVLRSSSLSEPEKVETGRVELGDKSEQKFKEVNMEFETYASHTVEYKILPQSRLKVEELVQYCSGCSKKIKSNWKFCTKCGTKVE